jgi:transposase
MVDLTRHDGRPQARLLDLVPGRSGKAYADWLSSRGARFTAGVKTATLDPFRGYSNAIRDELQDATAVLDAFHVVRLGLKAMEETRRRVQQEQLGHRGRKPDPLYRIRNALRAGADKLTARQIERIEAGLQAGDPHFGCSPQPFRHLVPVPTGCSRRPEPSHWAQSGRGTAPSRFLDHRPALYPDT